MASKYEKLINGSSQKATWISFSRDRQLKLINYMIKIGYKDAQIRKLYVSIDSSKLSDQITLVGIMIINEIEFDTKMSENDLRDFIISKWDDLKSTFESKKITRSMIKNDQSNYRFSIKSLLILASTDAKLIKYLIDLAD